MQTYVKNLILLQNIGHSNSAYFYIIHTLCFSVGFKSDYLL